MPFTGTGTGIANANDIFFSGLAQDQVLRFNSTTSKWNNAALSVTTNIIADDAVTEPKIAISNSPSNNQFLRWNGTALEWASLAYEAVITSGTTGQYWRGDKTWQTLDKSAVGLANVDNTADASKPVSAATQTALNDKAAITTTISGTNSISGGGDLSANRTVALVNDAASPGNSKYYGTDGTGTRGFFNLSTANPSVGGDLTGTVSNAQIATGAVGTSELGASAVTTAKVADDAITEPKLVVSNSPSSGQVLAWNGSAMTWSQPFSFTKVSITSSYTANANEYVFADATTSGITVTLPAPQANAYVRVKRMSSNANGVQIVAPNGSYIDSLSVGSDVLNGQFDSSEYWSDGTNWYR